MPGAASSEYWRVLDLRHKPKRAEWLDRHGSICMSASRWGPLTLTATAESDLLSLVWPLRSAHCRYLCGLGRTLATGDLYLAVNTVRLSVRPTCQYGSGQGWACEMKVITDGDIETGEGCGFRQLSKLCQCSVHIGLRMDGVLSDHRSFYL